MRVRCYRWIARLIAVCIMVVSSGAATALVPTSANGVMNKAVGSVIQSKATAWGLSPSDVRVTGTVTAAGSALTTVAVGAATGAVATMGWPALLVAAGVNALVGGAITIGVGLAYDWLFGSDGKVTQKTASESSPAGAPQMVWCSGYGTCAASFSSACNLTPSFGSAHEFFLSVNSVSGTCDVMKRISEGEVVSLGPSSMGQMTGCPGINLVPANGVCPPSNFPQVGSIVFSDADGAVQALPQTAASVPVSSELLAAAANTAWKGAVSSPNMIPWSASDPITPADVDAWRVANPSLVPTIQDFIEPASQDGSTVSLGQSPSGGTGTGGFTQSGGATAPPTQGSGQQVDLGPDPNIGAPNLESMPTAQMILGPLLSLMPDLKNFVLPSHSSVCPVGSFSVFNRAYVLDSHCTLLEQNRALIEGAMLLAWTILSVMIVLRA